ncbi:hypothetical protein Rcae01_06543 [Novipirellula caenicola]|uniref:Uncharacterized protein n=1 Tax=Novipirellula caenicola TaxID=1536901 RepID=A0ABP9W2L3_9BACT
MRYLPRPPQRARPSNDGSAKKFRSPSHHVVVEDAVESARKHLHPTKKSAIKRSAAANACKLNFGLPNHALLPRRKSRAACCFSRPMDFLVRRIHHWPTRKSIPHPLPQEPSLNQQAVTTFVPQHPCLPKLLTSSATENASLRWVRRESKGSQTQRCEVFPPIRFALICRSGSRQDFRPTTPMPPETLDEFRYGECITALGSPRIQKLTTAARWSIFAYQVCVDLQ